MCFFPFSTQKKDDNIVRSLEKKKKKSHNIQHLSTIIGIFRHLHSNCSFHAYVFHRLMPSRYASTYRPSSMLGFLKHLMDTSLYFAYSSAVMAQQPEKVLTDRVSGEETEAQIRQWWKQDWPPHCRAVAFRASLMAPSHVHLSPAGQPPDSCL